MDEPLFEVPEEMWHRRRCVVCGGALSVSYAHTYMVQRQGWVKIGATNNLRRRINELARPAWTQHLISPEGMDWKEPLVVLGTTDVDVEHQLHMRFREDHAAGEWFRPTDPFRSFMADCDWKMWGGMLIRERLDSGFPMVIQGFQVHG